MNDIPFNFDLYVMVRPKTRADCELIAREIIAECDNINEHITAAITKCEAENNERLLALAADCICPFRYSLSTVRNPPQYTTRASACVV